MNRTLSLPIAAAALAALAAITGCDRRDERTAHRSFAAQGETRGDPRQMSTTGVARAQPTSSVSWREHVRAHPLVAGGLAIGVLAVCFLLAESLVSLNEGGPSRALVLALYGGTAGFLTTALGALPALLLRTMPHVRGHRH